MRIHAIFLVASILTVALFGVAVAKPAGQGAFLMEYADTVQQLVSQVENSRLVALRYAKHFRTDPSSVLTFYRNELSLFKLPETTSLRVYYLDDSHNIVSEVREFKAGTWVFANKAAVPILELGTGNPLSSTLLTGELPKKTAEGLKASNPIVTPNEKVAVQVLEQPPTELPKLATENANLPASPASPSATVASNAGTATSSATSAGTAGRISSTNWLVPLGVVGAAVALAGGGGGSSNAIVPPPNGGGGGTEPPPNGGGTNPPVIPEPMSVLTLAAGIATLAAGIYRRKLQN